MQDDPVLQRFSLSHDDLLGFGGESRVYRTYYSLYFSPVKRSDPRLYAWCVANLIARR